MRIVDPLRPTGFRLNASTPEEATSAVTAGGLLVRREWRAPREHGAAVIDPSWPDLPGAVSDNTAAIAQWPGGLAGLSWADWRSWCRQSCLAAAREYTSNTLGVTVPESEAGPLIVGGHQPALFHPGVWAKNMAIHRLAQRVQGCSVHLIVDNDASGQATISIPAGSPSRPRLQPLAFDAPRPAQPWESAVIQVPALFTTFAERVTEAMAPWGIVPVVQDAWSAAVAQLQRQSHLVPALTAARVSMERQWGVQNLELPLSRVCQLPPFHAFVLAISERLPEFAGHYNQVLGEYRRLNHIRSRAHPVPELGQQNDWYEAPFWVWRSGATHRDRLWVRQAAGEVVLRDRQGEFARWSTTNSAATADALQVLAKLESQGIHLRSRALTTTLFARLGLADIFVHGLGGAKYDEMTDALIARFFAVPAPQFGTISATFHLPFGISSAETALQRGQLLHRQRDLDHNPQRYLAEPPPATAEPLLAQRRQLLVELDPAAAAFQRLPRYERRKRYLQLRETNLQLAALLDGERTRVADSLNQLGSAEAASKVLRYREFSWVLFPEETLRSQYERLFG